jgi:ATP/maltotriose-dependent transcriptional regulator MalT
VRVLEEAAEVARDAGEHQRGLAFTEAALAQLDAAVDPARVALLLSQRHTFRRDLGQPVDAADLDRALSLVPPDASHPARTALLLGAVHYGCHEGGARYRGWAEEALRLARAAGDRASEAQALVALAVIEAGPLGLAGPGSEPLRLLAEARQIAEEVGAYQPVIKLVVYESHLLCGAGEYERAAVVAQLGIADAERHGLARTRGAFLAINLAEPLLYLGRWDEAMEVVERALDLAPPSLTRVGLWIMSGGVALARGDTATATRRAAASRAVLAGVTYDDQEHLPQAVLDIELALAAEGPAAAVAMAAEALQRYEVSGSSPRYVWPLLVSAAAVAAVAAREAADAADALLGKLRTLAEKLEVSGPVQRAWQLSYAAVDPQADAVDRLAAADEAAAAWEAVKQPYPAAIALVRAATIALAGPGGREAAAARLRRAAPIAERLGARPLAEQIAGLSRRAGDPPAGDAAAGRDRLGLTGREFEVLRLVAAGQSNRDIATALFISPKTASVHVSNILGKLGAATRTEAAAKAHALRLFDAS